MPFPLIGAAVGLLGGLISGRSRQKAAEKAALQERQWAIADRDEARVYERGIYLADRDESRAYARGTYQRLVQDAEAAGFNPLTALRNGGAAGYTADFQPMLTTGIPTPTASGLRESGAVGEALGAGISGIGNFIANFDPFEDKLREAQYGVLQAQLENLQVDTAARRQAMFQVPAVSGRRSVTAGPSISSRTNLDFGGARIYADPGTSDAGDYEQRWGEVAGAMAGFGVMAADAWENLPRAWGWMTSGVDVRKLSPAEAPVGSHWWPSYMPRVSIHWR